MSRPPPSLTAAAACLAAIPVALASAAADSDPVRASARSSQTRVATLVGRSAEGRPIRAVTIGDPRAPRVVLVVGCIHGNEPAGIAIARAARSIVPPPGVRVVVVEVLNPDGRAHNTRQNGRGVDLNRNFPYRWRRQGAPGSTYYAGPRALSEPESRAARALILRLRPAVTIYYHQHLDLVDARSGGDPGVERRYAQVAGLRFVCLAPLPGTVTGWQNHALPHTAAFVVELPAGAVDHRALGRHLRALRAVELGQRAPGRAACA